MITMKSIIKVFHFPSIYYGLMYEHVSRLIFLNGVLDWEVLIIIIK